MSDGMIWQNDEVENLQVPTLSRLYFSQKECVHQRINYTLRKYVSLRNSSREVKNGWVDADFLVMHWRLYLSNAKSLKISVNIFHEALLQLWVRRIINIFENSRHHAGPQNFHHSKKSPSEVREVEHAIWKIYFEKVKISVSYN